jgi:hypothetical protein
MSHNRLDTLYLFLMASAMSWFFWWASTLPEDSRVFRGFSKVLDSWFLNTRWSLEPRARLKMMAIVGMLLALLMLYFFIANPPLR